jgi:glycosidase
VKRLASLALAGLLAGPAAARDLAKEAARPSPGWVRDAVVYELFPRAYSARGDFASVTARLAELQELGVSVLWLMPVNPLGKLKSKGSFGSPYAVRDYDAVNPDYGTRDDLKQLVAQAHRRGIKVILDVVLNHTAWDSVLLQKHPEYFTHDASGQIVSPVPDWTDVADLDYSKPGLRAYLVEMLKRWVTETDVDGFRCDVAGYVPTDFWEQVRDELQKVKPELFLLAEWDSGELVVKAFDAIYAWPFHQALAEVFLEGKPASWLRAAWEKDRDRLPRGALQLRFSDNHDERRAIVRFGEKGALLASALVFTLDGVPLIYNGMEVGDTAESGAPALFEKHDVNWAFAERRPEFPKFYRQITALRREHEALRRGDLAFVRSSDDARVLSYLRRSATEEVLVALNFSSQPFVGTLEVLAGFQEITPEVAGRRPLALPALSLGAWGYRIFARPLP